MQKRLIKIFGVVICSLISHFGQAQDVYSWINQQYIPGSMNHYDSYAIHALMGNVKSIHEVVEIYKPNAETERIVTDCEFLLNGEINQIDQLLSDGSISKTWFDYHLDGQTYHQWWVYLFNTGEGLDTIRYDSLGVNVLSPVADSIVKDERGNTLYFNLNGDEVFTFYDKAGRKVRDSIPASLNTAMHEITYRYRRKKIKRTEFYPTEKMKLKTTFTLDESGNWIKCMVKNGRSVNAVLIRTLTYHPKDQFRE